MVVDYLKKKKIGAAQVVVEYAWWAMSELQRLWCLALVSFNLSDFIVIKYAFVF